MDKVIAVTVTYNRSETLINTVNGLLKQSYELYRIIIVDNKSSEIHRQKIDEISKKDNRIIVLNLSENTGGAGGFYNGVKYVNENFEYDYIWIMDDDAYSRDNTLNNLIKAAHQLEEDNNEIGFLAPLVWGVRDKKYQIYHHKKITKYKDGDLIGYNQNFGTQKYIPIEANAFVGPLFSKKAVDLCGYPDSNLFIYGDDTEYTYRISRKMKSYLIIDSIIDHEDLPAQNNIVDPKSWWKEYYMLRNKIFFVREFGSNPLTRIVGYLLLSIKILKSTMAALVKKQYLKYRMIRIKLLTKALMDGLRGKTGKTLDPSHYFKILSEKASSYKGKK